jgi:hypothetical protein
MANSITKSLVEWVETFFGNLRWLKNLITTHTNNTGNPHGVTKSQVGLENVNNTSDENKPVSTATQTALGLKIDKARINQPTTGTGSTINYGIPFLNGNGKIPEELLPDTILGQMEFCGFWNALNGQIYFDQRPIDATTGIARELRKGDYYICAVGSNGGTGTCPTGNQGAKDINGNYIPVNVGDWAIVVVDIDQPNIYEWHILENSDALMSVNGREGNVVITLSEFGGAPDSQTLLNDTASAVLPELAGNKTVNAWLQTFLNGLKWVYNNKYTYPSGTSTQYIRGDGTLAAFPTSMTPTAHTHNASDINNITIADDLVTAF